MRQQYPTCLCCTQMDADSSFQFYWNHCSTWTTDCSNGFCGSSWQHGEAWFKGSLPFLLTVILFMDVSIVPSSSWSLKQKLCVKVWQHRLGFSSPARCWMSWKSCWRASTYLPAQLLLGCLQLWRTGFDGLDAPAGPLFTHLDLDGLIRS